MNDLYTDYVKKYRSSLLTLLASVVLVWQAAAIVIGPAPGSYAMGKIYPFFKPYLVAMHQNNEWGFFAPDPAKGTLLRYLLVDKNGEEHVFKLTENLSRSDAGFLRYTSLYISISRGHQNIVDSAYQYLCRRHKSMGPRAIQFFMGHQLAISPEDFVAGHRPLDDNYMSVEYMTAYACSGEALEK